MACKLTYKGKRFNNRNELIRQLELEGILDQGTESNQRQQNRERVIQSKLDAFRLANNISLQIDITPKELNRIEEENNKCSF